MTSQHNRNKKHRPYQVKKSGIKDEYIDKQIIVLHAAMAHKLLSEPQLLEQVQQTLEQRRETGRIGYGAYITWVSILEMYHQPDVFIKEMTRDDAKMRRLRRKTPFVGILNEHERQQAINAGAIGTIDDISVLF
ncbi:hypothetical protein E2K93_16865 [Thalassotalea sp. HSM 43]|uniref:hypothetical protein n=1 Tax=Thalassotalea sp. HSM 43 TaxID=2552945 RepID=UPI001080040A|nr:hypothetical protein [Thalassotalea sp. HSM 43]QBY05931.1 hypothetical protein E2K93_16865 [Thalassotalea sp. HSM 43]